MKLYELMENLYLDLPDVNRTKMTTEIIKQCSISEITNLVDVFLKGIGSKHSVPGNVVWTIQEINYLVQDGIEPTFKQIHYVLCNILDYWDQVSIEMRVELNL